MAKENDINDFLSNIDLEKAHNDPYYFDKISVINDLKRKGEIVEDYIYPNSILIKRKKEVVFILDELIELNMRELIEYIDHCRRRNLNAKIAIVDKYGDITYYSISQINIK